MDCTEARSHLLARERGTLPDDPRAAVDAHLAGCEACRHEEAAERALSAALREGLPRRAAPPALRLAIEAKLAEGTRTPDSDARRRLAARHIAAPVAFVVGGAIAAAVFLWRPSTPDLMVAEAVNDHLRVLYGAHPLEIESGGVHQVKPWFEGRVDFAPVVAFGGDGDFPLEGGAIAYFVDRKAAAYIYKRRLHVITLFVFPADGLPWPAAIGTSSVSLGRLRAREQATRGFHALLWRDGDLGYALVSDVDTRELETLGSKIVGGAGG